MNKLLTIFTLITAFIFTGCVHDDDFDAPKLECETGLTSNLSIADLLNMYSGTAMEIPNNNYVIEGYVSSSDEASNIYKSLYIQDAPENPTAAITISVDITDLYTKYPVGSKVYINLDGMVLGEYGSVIQLAGNLNSEGQTDRITAIVAKKQIIRSCDEVQTMVPKTVTLAELNDDLIGMLIKIEDVQIEDKELCSTYAYDEYSKNVKLVGCSGGSVTLRNSGYADFAFHTLPGGKGSITAIYSKYNSTKQILIRDINDVDFGNTRCDGSTFSCEAPTANATIQDIKDLYNGSLMQISDDLTITATVTANDESGNIYKYLYIQDETGGIRLKLNRTNLYEDPRFRLGKIITVSTQDLYLDTYGGEIQLGGLYNGGLGNIENGDIYKHVFSNDGQGEVTPEAKTYDDLTTADVGKLVTFETLQFAESEIGNTFSPSGDTNRTMEDCDGNNIIVRTSSYANFAGQQLPTRNGKMTGILTIYNGTFQLLIRDYNDVGLENEERCDGSIISPIEYLLQDDFSNFDNWTAISVTGNEAWDNPNYGNPAPCARMSGFAGSALENEDWLVSNAIAISSSVTTATFSFESVVRYSGNPIEVFYTTDYTGDVSTTNWQTLNPTLDTNTGSFSSWTNSGNLDISAAIGNDVYIAFKYTSDTSSAATWEIDNVKIAVQ